MKNYTPESKAQKPFKDLKLYFNLIIIKDMKINKNNSEIL